MIILERGSEMKRVNPIVYGRSMIHLHENHRCIQRSSSKYNSKLGEQCRGDNVQALLGGLGQSNNPTQAGFSNQCTRRHATA